MLRAQALSFNLSLSLRLLIYFREMFHQTEESDIMRDFLVGKKCVRGKRRGIFFFLIGERDKLRVASFDVLDCGIKIRCNFIECINAFVKCI